MTRIQKKYLTVKNGKLEIEISIDAADTSVELRLSKGTVLATATFAIRRPEVMKEDYN